MNTMIATNSEPMALAAVPTPIYLAIRGEILGPLAGLDLSDHVTKHGVAALDRIWYPGLLDWEPLIHIAKRLDLMPKPPQLAPQMTDHAAGSAFRWADLGAPPSPVALPAPTAAAPAEQAPGPSIATLADYAYDARTLRTSQPAVDSQYLPPTLQSPETAVRESREHLVIEALGLALTSPEPPPADLPAQVASIEPAPPLPDPPAEPAPLPVMVPDSAAETLAAETTEPPSPSAVESAEAHRVDLEEVPAEALPPLPSPSAQLDLTPRPIVGEPATMTLTSPEDDPATAEPSIALRPGTPQLTVAELRPLPVHPWREPASTRPRATAKVDATHARHPLARPGAAPPPSEADTCNEAPNPLLRQGAALIDLFLAAGLGIGGGVVMAAATHQEELALRFCVFGVLIAHMMICTATPFLRFATVGQWLMSILPVRVGDGAKMSFGQALSRYFASAFSTLLFVPTVIGYISHDGRTIGDVISRSVLLKSSTYDAERWMGVAPARNKMLGTAVASSLYMGVIVGAAVFGLQRGVFSDIFRGIDVGRLISNTSALLELVSR